MPFRALWDGDVVVPSSVPDGEPVVCPDCDETMYVRSGGDRARHFYHPSGGGGRPSASTGESSTHASCVALAVAALQEQFREQADRCAAEVEIDVSSSGSGNQIRRADALAEFESYNQYFGEGLVIEVQHRHEDKDARLATHDYLSADYSVVWLSSDDFGDEELDYAIVEAEFRRDDGRGYSVRANSAIRFLQCESYRYHGEHTWGTVPEYVDGVEEIYEICTSRGCPIRRQYDEAAGEYVYNPDSITRPNQPIQLLKNTLVFEHEPVDFEEKLTRRYETEILERALASRVEIDECPGSIGLHKWETPESLWGGAATVELRSCQYCSAHLLTDTRGYGRKDLLFQEEPDPDWDLLSLEANPRECDHKVHGEAYIWVEECPECGVSNPN